MALQQRLIPAIVGSKPEGVRTVRKVAEGSGIYRITATAGCSIQTQTVAGTISEDYGSIRF
jgi:hypothetical protein